MLPRIFPVALITLSLAACGVSEEAQIAAYFEESQSVAERMAEVGSTFETLMDGQDESLAWSEDVKVSLDTHFAAMQGLRDEAAGMAVPRAFSGAHPLLVQSIGEMAGAIDIIRGIANDPESATMQKAQEMTAKAENGEELANAYVADIEAILTAKYPEMMEEGDDE